jgi:hypothetical protein
VAGDTASDVDFNSEDGEELGDIEDDRRRDTSFDGRGGRPDLQRRLSREYARCSLRHIPCGGLQLLIRFRQSRAGLLG